MIIDVHAHAIPEAFRRYLRDRHADIGIDLTETPRGEKVGFGDRVTAPMRGDSMRFTVEAGRCSRDDTTIG